MRPRLSILRLAALALPLLCAACQHGDPAATGSICAPDSRVESGAACPVGSIAPSSFASDVRTASTAPAETPPPATSDPVTTSSVPEPPPTLTALPKGTAPADAEPARPSPFAPRGGPVSMVDAVANAVFTHPDIKVSEWRVKEAGAGVNISEAGLYPTLEARVGVGPDLSSSLDGSMLPFSSGARSRDRRIDGSVFLRQVVYDFGATDADIDRARLVMDSEKLKVRDKVEDIAYKTVLAHIKVLETRAMLALVDETIAAHKQLLGIVRANNHEGNGTGADVTRVLSRLSDVAAIRADISLQSLGAEEQFHRLTKLDPKRLGPVPSLRQSIPAGPEVAIGSALRRNPRLAAIVSTTRSIAREMDFQSASGLPRIQLEADSYSYGYNNPTRNRNEFDAKAMLTLRYRFLDGGLQRATVAQLDARRLGSEMSFINEREQLEADVRQAYRAVASAALKGKLVSDGVTNSRTVQGLYLEQFKAGRRTVFELLDSQMSLFSIRRNAIESQYDGQRAIFEILKATGELTTTLTGARGKVASAEPRSKPVSEPPPQPMPPKPMPPRPRMKAASATAAPQPDAASAGAGESEITLSAAPETAPAE